MTDYVAVPDASLTVGKPITATMARRLRDNAIAIAEGNTDAPPIWAQALRYVDIDTTQDWEVPQGVRKVYLQLWGAGAGGRYIGSAQVNYGAGAGGYTEGWVDVTPGAIIPVTIGAAGIAGTSSPSDPTNGGTTSFGSYMSATGGLIGAQMFTFNSSYNQTTIVQDLFTMLDLTQNGGKGVGGQFIGQGAKGEPSFSNPAEGGRGIGGAGGVIGDGVYYGDGGAARQGVSPAYAGKQGFARIWF